MGNFEKWDIAFRNQHLYAFNNNENGLLWLKVRAVCRGKQMKQFLTENGLVLTATKLAEQNVELFGLLEQQPSAMAMLDRFLQMKNHEWYDSNKIDEKKLREDLYKIQYYVWGGDQNNSLDKHLVSKYVKVISDYDELVSKHGEIAENAWNYVQASWYNNWTSYLIEALFKRHRRVVSAVGEIKSVDFFIDNYPIDLKVTYFPNQYMDEKLKVKLGQKELSWLRCKAKKLGVTVERSLTDSQQLYVLKEKLREQGLSEALDILKAIRIEVVREAMMDDMDLMTWLYAKQGEMRFGAENRLFVILVDTTDMEQSWKMKRAFSLIEPKVNDYLEHFNEHSLKNVDFVFKGNTYTSLADVLFIVR